MDKKKAIIIFIISFIGLISTNQSFAEMEQGPNYDKEIVKTNPDGTKSIAVTLYNFDRMITNYDQNGKPIYNKFKVTEDTDIIKVETFTGSVILHKNYCSFSFYKKGIIQAGQNALFSDSIVAKRATVGTSNWNNVNQINNEPCTPIITSNQTHVILTTHKEKANVGELDYQYIFHNNWKNNLLAINNSTLTDQKFGFTQTIDLNRDVIKWGNGTVNLQNYNGSVFDRTWIVNNKIKVIDFLNEVNFGFDSGLDYLNKVTVYAYPNRTSKLVFDYTLNDMPLLPNETFIVDPTFGYTGATSELRPRTAATTGASCGTEPYNIYTGAEFAFIPTTTDSSGCIRLSLEWNTSTIDDIANPTNVTLRFDVTSIPYTSRNCDFVAMEVTRPSVSQAREIYLDAGNGTIYVSNNPTCKTLANDLEIILGANAITDLKNKLPNDWFAIAIKLTDESRDGSYYGQSESGGLWELRVEYTTVLPPDRVNDLTASSITQTTAFLDWTQPNLNGGNLTNYMVNVTTPQTSNPQTFYANVTLSEITLSGLTLGTGYSARVSALTEGGYNATGNVVNFTTTTYITPAKPTLSATGESDTAVRFTSVNGTTGDFNIKDYGVRCSKNLSSWVDLVTNSTVPNQRIFIYSGITTADTVTCQWRDGSAAGWSPWSENATGSPQLTIIQSQRSPTSNPLSWIENFINEKGGIYFGLSLFPFFLMLLGLLATPRTTRFFTLIVLFAMGIVHASGFYVFPTWYWYIAILLAIPLVFGRRGD